MASKAALAALAAGSNPTAPIMMNAAPPSAYTRQHFLSEPVVNMRFHQWRSIQQQETPRLYQSSSRTINGHQSSITNNSPEKVGSYGVNRKADGAVMTH
eukprot:scaffold558407_cov14-Prasinocladus_malaysianus.AAC.1